MGAWSSANGDTASKPAGRRGVRASDGLLAGVVFLFTALGAADAAAAPLQIEAVALLAVAAAPLVAHRRWPLAVFAVTVVAHTAYLLAGFPEAYEWLATIVALGSVARARGWRFTAPIAGMLAVAPIAARTAQRGLQGLDAQTLLMLLGLTTAVTVGEWLRTRHAYLEEARERARLAELTRQQEAHRLVHEERLRLAREVHDVVAHAIASINVQAGVGQHVARRNPERALDALSQIRHVSRAALDDLRSALGMLRDDRGDAPEPEARLDDLDRLVTMARDAGLDVDVAIEGRRPDLSPQVEHAAYRILQESITNAVKHAGMARLTIAVEYQPQQIRIHVEDDGDPPAGSLSEGHGLRGLRERATAVGGTIHIGPRGHSGFAVLARLPVNAPAG